MTKQYFTALAAYNSWANDKAMVWLGQINEAQWNRSFASSFGSVRNTAVHIASAEKIWIDFWTKASNSSYLSVDFQGAKIELISIWKTASTGMHDFITNCPEENYNDSVPFVYPRGGSLTCHQLILARWRQILPITIPIKLNKSSVSYFGI